MQETDFRFALRSNIYQLLSSETNLLQDFLSAVTKQVNSCGVIEHFVNSLCKVCWRTAQWWCCRAVNPQAEKKRNRFLTLPLLPPFAADLSGQLSPSLHSFSCALLGRLFLYLLLPYVLLLYCLTKQPCFGGHIGFHSSQ